MSDKAEKKTSGKDSEIEYLYKWMDKSVSEEGFSTTWKCVQSRSKIGPYRVTEPVRVVLQTYFKILLDTPMDSIKPARHSNRLQRINT